MSAKPTAVLIGPGGVGKGTVARALVAADPTLWLSRSWTTRPPRPRERGDEYTFTDEPTFRAAIAAGTFLEWAEFHGHLYGSPVPRPGPGQRVLLEIEVQGARQVLAREPDAVVILLVPPSVEELARRLRARGDADQAVRDRLNSAAAEMAEGRALTTHVVINDQVERAVREVLSILDGPHRDR